MFSKLDGAGLTVKRSKCEWGKSGLIYLGHRIGDGRMAVPGDRASAVENFIIRRQRKKESGCSSEPVDTTGTSCRTLGKLQNH